MTLPIEERRLVLVADSADPSPGSAAGAPSAVSASPTRPADGAPTPPAVSAAGGAALPRALALSGSDPGQTATSASHADDGGASHATRASHPVRPPQSFQPFAAADGASPPSLTRQRPGRAGGSGRDVPHDFDAHVDRALTAGGFAVVDPLGPRLVEPAPVGDPALRWSERVWISVRRTGIDRHRLSTNRGSGFTACGRSAHAGRLLPADDPWIVEHTRPCPRCWPGGA